MAGKIARREPPVVDGDKSPAESGDESPHSKGCVLHSAALASAAGGRHVGDGSQPGRPAAAHGGVGEAELLLTNFTRFMLTLRRYVLPFSLLVCLTVGCHSAVHEHSPKDSLEVHHDVTPAAPATPSAPASSKDPPDVYHYVGAQPVLIFIPLPSFAPEDNRGYPAEIALPPHRGFTDDRIEVEVNGAVASRGVVRLRSGGTVLEAVDLAGGFEPWAYAKRVSVFRRSGEYVKLYLHWRRKPGAPYRSVWYDTREEADSNVSESDYVLSAGDKVYVGKTVG